MNIFLNTVQVLLALHTLTGAVWKFSHSVEQTMPSLSALPNSAWLSLSIIEIICALLLILPLFIKKLGKLIPFGALIIALEMMIFCGLHMASGASDNGPIIYWMVVAFVATFIAIARLKLKPITA